MRKTINILLIKDVANLGQKNELKTTRLGYAKNWLIPNQLGVLATKTMIAQNELRKTALIGQKEQMEKEFESLIEQLADVELILKPKRTAKGTLYAAIDKEKIAEGLKRKKIALDTKYIELEEPIKKIGEYSIPITFSDKLKTVLKITIQ